MWIVCFYNRECLFGKLFSKGNSDQYLRISVGYVTAALQFQCSVMAQSSKMPSICRLKQEHGFEGGTVHRSAPKHAKC